MRRLMYLSVSLLCLSLTLALGIHIGTMKAEADVAPSGYILLGDRGIYITSIGEAWGVDSDGNIVRQSQRDLPLAVAPTDIKLFKDIQFVTSWDEIFYYSTSLGWVSAGTLPGGPVNVESSTWGRIKNDHKDGGQ